MEMVISIMVHLQTFVIHSGHANINGLVIVALVLVLSDFGVVADLGKVSGYYISCFGSSGCAAVKWLCLLAVKYGPTVVAIPMEDASVQQVGSCCSSATK